MQDTLAREAAARGLPLTDDQLAQFDAYYRLLVEWNARFNLTRITEAEAVQVQHFLDSLALLAVAGEWFPHQAKVIDVGAGAGLPGLALKIARPDLAVVLTDSVAKKAQFVDHVIRTLGLIGAQAVHARAEDLGRDGAYRDGFDVAVARAVADLPVLAEYLLPFVRVGGAALAQKGARAAEEVARAAKAVRVLGGGAVSAAEYRLPGLDEARAVVVMPKAHRTPPAYPRRAGLPAKEPIGG